MHISLIMDDLLSNNFIITLSIRGDGIHLFNVACCFASAITGVL